MKIRTLRHREVQKLARGHTASKLAGPELEPRELIDHLSIRVNANIPQLNQIITAIRRLKE